MREDIEHGEWLFGRGTMDMKCGLALQMAMIEQACEGRFDRMFFYWLYQMKK